MWGMLLRNPRASIMTGLGLALLIVLGLLIWRVNYLSDRTAKQEVAIAGYEKAMADLEHNTALREAITRRDNLDSLANERNRAMMIGDIEGTGNEEDGAVAPVLRNTIERLFYSNSTTSN